MQKHHESAHASGRWLACRERRPEAKYRLYCFPHSGGSAGEFVVWADQLPEVEVLGIQLPGRGARLERGRVHPDGAAGRCHRAEVTFDGPFAFFGHSLGALVAYEVARVLHATGRRPPDRLFASACPAPHLPRIDPPIHQLPDEELAALINQEYASLPAEIMENPDLLRLSPSRPPLRLRARGDLRVRRRSAAGPSSHCDWGDRGRADRVRAGRLGPAHCHTVGPPATARRPLLSSRAAG